MPWKQFYLDENGKHLFCNAHLAGRGAMNVVVTHTPVVSTVDIANYYAPLAQYGVNVFAFDFSGTGKSGGREADFSRRTIVEDLDLLVEYVAGRFPGPINLYGSTGIGGIFAQYYVCQTDRIKSFAQFACLTYGETVGLGYPRWLVQALCPVLHWLPNMRLTMKPPKYTGFHQELDEAFYGEMLRLHPDFWRCSTKVTLALLEMAVAGDSAFRRTVDIPTLVFQTMHDRYFSPAHFERYFAALKGPKRLIRIDDVHNSYYIHSERFCKEVYTWFQEQADGPVLQREEIML